jgi:DNA-binding IclR family transcriptional regulator
MLEKSLRILQSFRPGDGGLRLMALVQRTGMPKSTVHRLVTELLDQGLLADDGEGSYSPGMALFELSSLVPAIEQLRTTAQPYLQDLLLATRQTVHLAVRDDLDAVYVDKIHGHSDLGLPSRLGGRLPLVCTGIGRALLAHEPPAVQRRALARPTRRLLDGRLVDADRLALELAEIRQAGLAFERGEIAPGQACIASPVLVAGAPVAAISLSVQVHHFNLPALAGTVRMAAARLGQRLAEDAATEPSAPRAAGVGAGVGAGVAMGSRVFQAC